LRSAAEFYSSDGLVDADSDFAQMRLKPMPEAIKPLYLAIIIIVFGIFFVPTGTNLLSAANNVDTTCPILLIVFLQVPLLFSCVKRLIGI
jgi:hypothetical protein